MAEIGKGDPRWIVTERDDGKNVNGWHWEEKNCLQWAQGRLEEIFKDLQIPTDPSLGAARFTGVQSLTGECNVHTRKGGKKAAVFELELVLGWSGQDPSAGDSDSAKPVSGELKITHFDNVNDPDEYVFTATVSNQGQNHERFKQAVLKARGEVEALLTEFVEELARQ